MTTWGQTRSTSRLTGRSARSEDRRDRDRSRFSAVSSAAEIEQALLMLPTATCIMTAAYEHKRMGMVVSRVMRAADEPLSIAVAVPTGQRLTMLIRDSRAFGLCFVDRSQRALLRRFGDGTRGEGPACIGDPFDTQPTRTMVTGSPILSKAIVALDCEVVRHFDLESDHEIYVGVVLGSVVESVIAELAGQAPVAGVGAAGASGAGAASVRVPSNGAAAPASLRALGSIGFRQSP